MQSGTCPSGLTPGAAVGKVVTSHAAVGFVRRESDDKTGAGLPCPCRVPGDSITGHGWPYESVGARGYERVSPSVVQ